MAVRDRADRGEYDGLDGPGLAGAPTLELQGVNRDKHLLVEYSAEILPPARESASIAPPPEAMEEIRRGLAPMNHGLRKVEILDGNVG